MTAQQPFTSKLICSEINLFRYNWIWDKGYSTGFVNANKMPMKGFEDVCVFYKRLPTYNPQGILEVNKTNKRKSTGETLGGVGINNNYKTKFTGYPKGKIKTKKEKTFHPTGKPVALMEYLIKTYTNEGETVLDFTMGSGTCGVAAKNTNRKFIGIELDEEYFKIAQDRISAALENKGDSK